MPGLLAASRDFFRNYKVPRGGKYNVFGFEGECKILNTDWSDILGHYIRVELLSVFICIINLV